MIGHPHMARVDDFEVDNVRSCNASLRNDHRVIYPVSVCLVMTHGCEALDTFADTVHIRFPVVRISIRFGKAQNIV